MYCAAVTGYVLVVDMFHKQSVTAKKSGSEHDAKDSLHKRLSRKQKSKVLAKRTSGKFKKDGSQSSNSKTVRESSDVDAARKRRFPIQRNIIKRKKRRTT